MSIKYYNWLFCFLAGLFCTSEGASAQKLTGKAATLEVTYSAISCECAQWKIKTTKVQEGYDSNIYLEPANENLINADSLWDGIHLPLRLKVTGQFYKDKGFPKKYKSVKGDPEPARVFRYVHVTIIPK